MDCSTVSLPDVSKLSKMNLNRVLVLICGTLALSWATGVRALYDPSGPVTDLTPTTFDSKIKQGIWMVEFYAPWYDAWSHCVIARGGSQHDLVSVQVWSLSAAQA